MKYRARIPGVIDTKGSTKRLFTEVRGKVFTEFVANPGSLGPMSDVEYMWIGHEYEERINNAWGYISEAYAEYIK